MFDNWVLKCDWVDYNNPSPHKVMQNKSCELASMISRYPSPAELDAFAQKTANSPLSIKIFPSDVRVPQHKQLNKTVNGLDTTGHRHSSYSHPYSGGYQGLLAIVKASVVVKGVVKNSEGRRTKHTNTQTSVAPYNNPLNNGYRLRHGHKFPTVRPGCGCGGTFRLGLYPGSAAPEQSGSHRSSTTYKECRHSQNWVPRERKLHNVAAQTSNSAAGHRAAEAGVGQSPETCLPLVCSSQLSYRLHPPSVSAGQEHVSATSLNCAAMQGDFSVGQHFAPLWDSVVSTPNNDCYNSQVLATGTCPQLNPPLPLHTQAYSTDQNLCCGLPSSTLCHAAVLSSSLQSLECLISEIHPPCIKERMLGRGYEAMGMPQLLEHHQQTNIQLPVYR
uniref:Uncharacterized protein n=1 Tax=Monopterus albus TaxID=43700 RepID=A0A3Q3JQW4_MONAL